MWLLSVESVPLEILKVLAKDVDPHVRYSVAEKRKLDEELFDALSRDPDESVRERIAYNRKTPAAIVDRLTNDNASFVRAAALKAHRRTRDAGE